MRRTISLTKLDRCFSCVSELASMSAHFNTRADFRRKNAGSRSMSLLVVIGFAVSLSACNHTQYLCDDVPGDSLKRSGDCPSTSSNYAGLQKLGVVSRGRSGSKASPQGTGGDISGASGNVSDTTGSAAGTSSSTSQGGSSGGSTQTSSTDSGSKSNRGHGNDDEQTGAGRDGFDADNPGKGGRRG